MKKIALLFSTALLVTGFATTAFGQGNYLASAETPTAPEGSQEKVVTIKNNCDRSVAIFAGPKEGIREPRLNAYGGKSTNKVYVMPNDVVCLMSVEKKPIACTIIKPETTVVEVNTSATGVTGK